MAHEVGPLELMGRRVETLFVCDPAGRLVRVEDPWGARPAPRFFLGRTVEGNLWRARSDLPRWLTAELDEIASREPVLDDLTRPIETLQALVAALTRHAPAAVGHRGPAWVIPEDADAPLAGPGELVEIDAANTELVLAGFGDPAPALDRLVPCAAVVVDGVAATACYCSRRTRQSAEAGLGTRAEHRGRGYGPAATAAWARAVRRGGRLPFYSTVWENAASRRVAEKLEMVLIGEDVSLA